MTAAPYSTESADSTALILEPKFIRDEYLQIRLSEADDSRNNRRGRYHYRDNPTTARSLVVTSDDAPSQSSASFHTDPSRIMEDVQRALMGSGYPLARVHCTCQGNTVTVSGVVKSYYHAQVAINAVMHAAQGRQLDYQIKVVSDQD